MLIWHLTRLTIQYELFNRFHYRGTNENWNIIAVNWNVYKHGCVYKFRTVIWSDNSFLLILINIRCQSWAFLLTSKVKLLIQIEASIMWSECGFHPAAAVIKSRLWCDDNNKKCCRCDDQNCCWCDDDNKNVAGLMTKLLLTRRRKMLLMWRRKNSTPRPHEAVKRFISLPRRCLSNAIVD